MEEGVKAQEGPFWGVPLPCQGKAGGEEVKNGAAPVSGKAPIFEEVQIPSLARARKCSLLSLLKRIEKRIESIFTNRI